MTTHRSPTARLFVAIDPPEDVGRRLASWARLAVREARMGSRGGGSPLRVLDPELLHLTICFVGNRPVGEIEALGDRLASCAGPVGTLSIGAPLWLPPRRPRALAVELHDDSRALAHMHAEIVTAFAQAGEEEPSESPPPRPGERAAHERFHPHITVARMGRDSAPSRSPLPPTPALSFVPTELVLYRSRLSPDGASYEALASHPIG